MANGKSMGAIIAVAITGLILTMVTSGALTANQTVPSSGSITAVNVGVYTNSACTNNCTSIDWGSVAPSASVSRTVYVKNLGTVPMTVTMAAMSWVPSNAGSYLSVSWNRDNDVLAAGASVQATLTLTASASAGAISSFSFNIVITGTE